MAQLVKNLPAMWETWVPSLGWEDSLEKGIFPVAFPSTILAWRIPWTVQSMGSQSRTRLRDLHLTSYFNYLTVSSIKKKSVLGSGLK